MIAADRQQRAGRWPGASLALAAIAVIAAALPGLASQLEFSRTAIAGGEVWRWVTGHWAHCSWDHLAWDVGTFALLGWLCERESRARFWCCIAGSAVAIPMAVWLAHPELATYRGLSGIDSALFMLLVVTVAQRGIAERAPALWASAAVISLGFAAKMIFEVVTGTTVFVDSASAGMVPVPLAHLVGGAVGVLCGLTPSVARAARRPAPGSRARSTLRTGSPTS